MRKHVISHKYSVLKHVWGGGSLSVGLQSNNRGVGRGNQFLEWEKIKRSKFNKGSTEHRCVELYSEKRHMFSVQRHSESYSCRLTLVGSSPGFGLLPAGRSFVPRWLDPTHLTACTPAAGLCNKDT